MHHPQQEKGPGTLLGRQGKAVLTGAPPTPAALGRPSGAGQTGTGTGGLGGGEDLEEHKQKERACQAGEGQEEMDEDKILKAVPEAPSALCSDMLKLPPAAQGEPLLNIQKFCQRNIIASNSVSLYTTAISKHYQIRACFSQFAST